MDLNELINSIKVDLGVNFKEGDDEILNAITKETFNDALFISNRKSLYEKEGTCSEQIEILAPNVRRCVKTIYLQRGSEDVSASSLSGLSVTFDDAIKRMHDDIVKQGKRKVR